jgi:ferric enterobactin receptor
MLMGSVYYKHTDHLITGYIESDTSLAGAVSYINTYINAASSYSAGGELTGQYTFYKWWDASLNINIYQSQINLGDGYGASQSALLSWFGKFNTNFHLPAGFTLQLAGMYQSKTDLPINTNSNQPGPPNMQSQSASQGYIKPFYEVDVAVKKMFMSNKLALSLSFNDIFRSRTQDQYTYSDYFVQEYNRLRDPQMLRLNLTYNFGKLETNLFEKKNDNVQMEE